MATTQGTQVTLQVPEGAPPGCFLAVPIRGGAEQVKIRVPDGCGPGSTLILTKAVDATEWDVKVGNLVPLPQDTETNAWAAEGASPGSDVAESDHAHSSMQPISCADRFGAGMPASPPRESLRLQGPCCSPSVAASQRDLPKPGMHAPEMQNQQHQQQSQSHREEREQHQQQFQQQSHQPQQYYEPVEPQPVIPCDLAMAYTVRLETTVGDIDIIVRPDWAPHGTRRFLELTAAGDFCGLAFYRAIKGCIAQFGLPARRTWPPIPDDPPTGVPFLFGAISFAAIGENSRKSTLFICTGDMSHCLGRNSWETPIGAVAESSLDVLDRIETMYGDIAEFQGPGPDTNRINTEGNAYLRSYFPHLSYIQSAVPMDWRPEDVLINTAFASACGSNSEFVDQASVAARAAQEAQVQATQATQLAQKAAQADHVAQAAQAAQLAQQAARAAQAAAEAAQAAQHAARRQVSWVPPPSEATPPISISPSEAEARNGHEHTPWRGQRCQSACMSVLPQHDVVDVPVEVKLSSRPSHGPSALIHATGMTAPAASNVLRANSVSTVFHPVAPTPVSSGGTMGTQGQLGGAPSMVAFPSFLSAGSVGSGGCSAQAAPVHIASAMPAPPHPQPHPHALSVPPPVGNQLVQLGAGGSLQFTSKPMIQLAPPAVSSYVPAGDRAARTHGLAR